MKASLRSPHMLPRLALVDPDLLAGAPARRAGGQRPRRAVAADRALPLRPGQPGHRRPGPRGHRRSARSLRRAVLEGADAGARARTWRWPACWAACAWPTPGWAPCTASPRRSAACSRAPRRGLRGAAGAGDGGQPARAARARPRAPEPAPLRRGGAPCSPAAPHAERRGRHRLAARAARGPGACRAWAATA